MQGLIVYLNIAKLMPIFNQLFFNTLNFKVAEHCWFNNSDCPKAARRASATLLFVNYWSTKFTI